MTDSLDWATASAAIAKWVRLGSGLAQDHVFWTYEGKPRPTAPYIEMTVQWVRGVGHDWVTSEQNTFAFGSRAVSAVSSGSDTLTITGHPFATGDGPVQLASSGTLPAPLLAATDYWIIVVDANTIKLATTYERTGGQQPLGAGNPVTPIDLTSAGTGSITVQSTGDTVPAGKEITRTAQGFREVTLHFECFAAEPSPTNTRPGYDAMRILSNVIASIQLYVYDLDQAGVGVSDFGQSFSQGGVQHLEGQRGSILEPRSMVDVTVYLASSMTGFETIIETIELSTSMTLPGGGTDAQTFTIDGTGDVVVEIIDGTVSFAYTATGAEGSDFRVTMPHPRSSAVYGVEGFCGTMAFNVGLQFPNAGGDRTTTSFRVLTTHALTAGDVLYFEVE